MPLARLGGSGGLGGGSGTASCTIEGVRFAQSLSRHMDVSIPRMETVRTALVEMRRILSCLNRYLV